MTAKARIAKTATELLAQEPEGLHHSVLIQQVKAALPDIPTNTIRGSVVGLVEYKPMECISPRRGCFSIRGTGIAATRRRPTEPSQYRREKQTSTSALRNT